MARPKKKPESDDIFEYGIDIPGRVLWVTGDVDMTNAVKWVKGLHILDTASDAPITIVINSDGGDMVQGFALIDAIRQCRSEVVGVVRGYASSAAFTILQSCDIRHATKHASLMTHQGNRESDFELSIDMDADQIALTRMQAVNPAFSMAKFQKWQAVDRYLRAAEALKLGLIDEVI
jgi:ATP-dependent Clp protease protease subunit